MNRKIQGMHPIFLGVWIIKYEFVKKKIHFSTQERGENSFQIKESENHIDNFIKK